MTQEEKCNTWMQIEEHNSIRRSCLQLIASVEKSDENRDRGDNENDKENGNGNEEKKIVSCTRGLESHFQKQARQNQLNRMAKQKVVLLSSSSNNQNGKYCSHGYYNDQAIADLYKSKGQTTEFQSHAERTAIQDRNDIEMYLIE